MNAASEQEWMELIVTAPRETSDVLAEFCNEHGSRGVILHDFFDPAKVTAYFVKTEWPGIERSLRDFVLILKEAFPEVDSINWECKPLKTENWAVMWQDNFKTLEVGDSLIVTPPWMPVEPQNRKVIVIEPAAAFGTGTHETTQGCLILLEKASKKMGAARKEFSLLDLGTGSGILAIAGSKLGATMVIGIDNDPIAVEAARKNAEINSEPNITFLCVGLKEYSKEFDIVTANLEPQTLLANREILVNLFRKFLIISGVPVEQWDQVKNMFIRTEVFLVDELVESQWGCGLFGKEY
jgi:ribosomal protein L11 methyltransferase